MVYVGIYDAFRIRRLVWHGLGAVARLFPVRDKRTGGNEQGAAKVHA
jgi:hypothetical protein